LKGLKSTATGASAASGPLGLPHCVGSRYFPHRFPVNQQRHPGRGFIDSSENKHPFHRVYFQSFRAPDPVRNGLKLHYPAPLGRARAFL